MLSTVARHISKYARPAIAEVHGGSLGAFYSAQAAPASNKFYDVPEGHMSSDLSPEACNIGLNRRRELTLGAAGNIKLTVDGKQQRLADLLSGKRSVIFGVPDCGKVCADTHLPGYLKDWDKFCKYGVNKIYCVVVGDPVKAEAWGKKVGLDGTKVKIATDTNGGLTRLLGVEVTDPATGKLMSQRYATVLDNGVIIKFKVDKNPADVIESSAKKMLGVLEACTKL